ncbi:WPP domain - like 1 [Theobroma cacao]|nr:WPP domain - like 1 [Theobroma cacao]
MADPESTTTQDNAPAAESNQAQAPAQVDDTTAKLNNLTLRIWPPTQRTRDAVINRLIETLSTQSVLSKRYGTIPEEEASAVAKSIEEEAYSVAGASFSADDDGIEILQVYSREISKRMLETVKARAAATAAAPSGPADADSSNAGAAGGEDISSSSVKAEA